MTHTANGHVARNNRRAEAEDRQIKRSERGPKAQIEVLNERLGSGKGAKKERARLAGAVKSTRRKVKKEA